MNTCQDHVQSLDLCMSWPKKRAYQTRYVPVSKFATRERCKMWKEPPAGIERKLTADTQPYHELSIWTSHRIPEQISTETRPRLRYCFFFSMFS